ncbi:MAG: 50S ribosomal protein L33 [Chloroflexi bacterium]|nr:50S ribosomal protein L33 [Chloroflexota bacterium]
MRIIINMECTDCKRRNYTSSKNTQNHTGRIELKKYCHGCRKHTTHKETR